jgi:hypothetical protein
LPAIASRVRNVLRSSKKMSMTPIDHINQQTFATYGREAVWPGNKSFQRIGVSGGMIKEVSSEVASLTTLILCQFVLKCMI